jgi:Flp pilus assembly protein TadG
MVMDGDPGNERILVKTIVSANVHRRRVPHVSFGGPQENRCKPKEDEFPVAPGGRGDRAYATRLETRSGDSRSRKGVYLPDLPRIGVSQAPGASSLQGGQSLVELALVLPMLLLLLVGVVEIGRYAYVDILVSNAARAGAQYGSQSLTAAKDVSGIQLAAQNDGLASFIVTPIQLCGCDSKPGDLGGCPTGTVCAHPLVYIQVTVKGPYSSLFSYPGLPASTMLTSTVTMRVTQ